MRRLFDFQCSDNHVTESLVSSDVTEHPCRLCQKTAQRIISPVKAKLDAISGDFPGATMKWAKNRQKQILHERKTTS
jgi:hypothetical protein